MASNLFGRYVWLIDTLRRHKRLTYEEINRLWQQSGLSYGYGDELAIRTFHNHRNAIFDIFDIEINCDTKSGYKYYIDNPKRLEGNSLRRWYVIARSPYYSDRNSRKNKEDGGNRPEDVYLVYALDRILDIQDAGQTFVLDEDFKVEKYFEGCCGIITSKEEPVKVIVKAYYNASDYLRTLPLHESQVELKEQEDDEACYFEYHVCPTFDFYQTLLAQADQIEVIEPESVRNEMFNFAKNLMKYYQK